MPRWSGMLSLSLLLLFFVPGAAVQWFARSLLILLGMSWIYSSMAVRHVTAFRIDQQPRSFRLTSHTLRIRIDNPLPFRIHSLLIKDDAGGLWVTGSTGGIVDLPAQSSVEFRYEVKSDRRGSYSIGPLRLLISDPFGLFPKEIICDESRPFLVLPRVLPLELLIRDGLPIGEIASSNPLYEDTGRFRSLRDYVPGDDLRRIHWKASAKTGTLQTIEYGASISAPLTVILDCDAGHYGIKTSYQNFERLIEAAASLVNHFDSRGQETRLLIYSASPGILPRSKNLTPFALEILAGLGSPEPCQSGLADLTGSEHFTQGERIVLLTPHPDETLIAGFVNSVPASCRQEIWFMPERVLKEGRESVSQLQAAFPRVRFTRLREFGEDLHDTK